ncbi:MAG: hypothetical protein JSV03_03860 [Planctomycetota bacterium]|nr:MAG: hypothetical protein JSV03_03860 [Planctomycetota bacterium]
MKHDWMMDPTRTRQSINVLVWRCKTCGCLQIKKGGLNAPSVYKPNDPAWNPFKTMQSEPPCLDTGGKTSIKDVKISFKKDKVSAQV